MGDDPAKKSERYTLRRKAGLCSRCPSWSEPFKTMCKDCLKANREKLRRRRARQLAKGLCVVPGCEREPAPDCKKCVFHKTRHAAYVYHYDRDSVHGRKNKGKSNGKSTDVLHVQGETGETS